jgi:hypothetical protein
MRHTRSLLAGVALILFGIGCSDALDKRAEQIDRVALLDLEVGDQDAHGNTNFRSALTDHPAKPAPGTMSSSAARTTGDTLRRFIRSADLKFRVKDVVQATYAIEDITVGFGGHVEHTQLNSRVDQRFTTPISSDSLLETTKFTVMNTATLRVPVEKLDTMLKSLARFVDFLDHRTVKADDVRLLLLSNRMAVQRIDRSQQRMTDAVDEQGKKLRETTVAEDRLLERQAQADAVKLSSLGLEDKIAFSTITLHLYQRQDIRYDVLANERNVDQYRPGFFSELGSALGVGWQILVSLVLFLARSWSVLLLIAVLGLLIWKVNKVKSSK